VDSDPNALTAGVWTNITTTREDNYNGTSDVRLRMYWNGELINEVTEPVVTTSAGSFKGAIIGYGGGTNYNSLEYYDGLFGSITMWNTTLTHDQIIQHIGATAPIV